MYISNPNIDADTINTFVKVASQSAYDTTVNIAKEHGGSPLKWQSFIGIVTAIIGNILISFALNIQRYAHIRLNHDRAEKEKSRAASRANTFRSYGATDGPRRNGSADADAGEAEESDPLVEAGKRVSSVKCEDDDHSENTTYLQSPYWWAGILLMTVGEAGNFLAYGFAPASIVSPLGVVALISNCIIAPFMLKEPFRLRDFWGVLIATGGAVTVVLSAKTSEKRFGPHEVWDAITTLEFEIYMGITVGLIIILMWASPRYGHKTVLVDLGLVGLFGGYTALSTKGVASMFSSTLLKAFATPVTYALLAVLVGTAVMQVRYVNKALQRFNSTQVIPVQFVLFTLSVIIGSAILYRDFEQATVERVSKFAGGCLLTFLGVSFITSGRESHDENENEDAVIEEDEENISLARQEVRPSVSSGSTKNLQIGGNVDGPVPGEMQWSRTSSHVSFADTATPKTPQRFQSTGSAPEILFTKTPDVEDDERKLETESAPLLSNPWRTPDGPSRHYSSPAPLVDAHSSLLSIMGTPQPPSEIHRSHSQDNPHTHPNLQSSPAPPQADPNIKERPVTPARTSLSLIIPGPLSSPLSGGLSAVVADSLRRGVNYPATVRSRRTSRPGIGGLKSVSQGPPLPQEDTDERPPPLKQSQTHDDVPRTSHGERSTQTLSGEDNGPITRSRARSMSNTLGDFLRGRRGKRDDSGV